MTIEDQVEELAKRMYESDHHSWEWPKAVDALRSYWRRKAKLAIEFFADDGDAV